MKPSHDIRPNNEEHDNLLLAEERHRTANEIASVLALLRLASRRGMDMATAPIRLRDDRPGSSCVEGVRSLHDPAGPGVDACPE